MNDDLPTAVLYFKQHFLPSINAYPSSVRARK